MLHKAFEVKVVNSEKETQNGYVYMKHGTQYKMELSNHRDLRCNAEIKIDGKSVGVWRIPAYETIVIERPSDDIGKFTFYKKGSKEAKVVDTGIADINQGLVEVEFTPEYRSAYVPAIYVNPWRPWYDVYNPWYYNVGSPKAESSAVDLSWSEYSHNTVMYSSVKADAFALNNFNTNTNAKGEDATAGMTGLSGKSDQKFLAADSMNLDYSSIVTIRLRLVAKRKRNSVKEEVDGPRPLAQQNTTPIPPAVR